MLSAEEIKQLVAGGEGYDLELKESLPSKLRDVVEEVCAFANAAGGTVLIGVNDANRIIGTRIDNAKRSALMDAIGAIDPTLRCEVYFVSVDGVDVWVIEVPSGPRKPYALGGAIHVRQGPNSQKLTKVEEMRDFFQQADRIYFDEAPCADFTGEDIDMELLAHFQHEAGLSGAVPIPQVLKNLHLLTPEGTFKNGAVLFFGKEPERFFEKAVVRCVRYTGTDKRYPMAPVVFGGPLYRQYEKAIAWVGQNINVRFLIEEKGTGPREEIWEIPQTVFKEALINALAHRDYYDKGGTTMVEVFDDRVEISNPGGLVSAIPKEQFGTRSHSRNPLVFGLFARMHMVEELGSGVIRMRGLMADAGLAAPEFLHDGLFTVVLRTPVDWRVKRGAWKDKLSANQLKIMDLIAEDERTSVAKLSAAVGISTTAIENNLAKLKELGVLDREGDARTGSWRIL
jgi:ATP-dependent DNA helicase RecG